MKVIILLIEGKKADHPSYFSGLVKKGFQVDTAPSGSAALAYLATKTPNLVLVDASSMRSNGLRICQAIRKNASGLPIVLMVDEDFTNLNNISANVVLIQPFTLQKLLNRIRPLLPIEQKDMLQVGDFRLDLEQRWVVVQNHQVRLTPRLVALLKILLEHPGQLIERDDLFRMVWETDYAGDTRTLDVHISWLRQALEDDPRNPQYLKTVRGVGYRLDVQPGPVQIPSSNHNNGR
ncbi:MAG: response regulator transcription factor [Anaerolineaceae bacterium]|nr:response regulator transcription factor [Anaerolineaceae bacterium]